jgi:transposase
MDTKHIKLMKEYSTNLTDSQWNLLESVLSDKRKRKHSLRDILNALFYLLKTGCQWRIIPHCFPPWESVYYYFSKWKNEGVIELIHGQLRDKVRKKAGRETLQVWLALTVNPLKQPAQAGSVVGLMVARKSKVVSDISLPIVWAYS